MPSIPLTTDEESRMLAAVGARTIEDLFSSIPPRIREKADFSIDLGEPSRTLGLSEEELRNFFRDLGLKNASHFTHFLGGGIYDNIIPAAVDALSQRGEFLTTYTPYQPEISQGTLQVIFEFQTLISRLTQMDVANASMYDGPTAAAEAVWMAQRLTNNKSKFLVARSLSPDTKKVIQTFTATSEYVEVPWQKDGTLNLDALSKLVAAENPSALVVGYPNYFGVVEPLQEIRNLLPSSTILVTYVADPAALSLFEAPGRLGADIVAGEAHQFGTSMSFGGPHLGFFATKKKFIRQMPGRLCGETVDARGKRAYTLTLSTREQHIRREKATSNICTNQGLMALRATIYLSFLGKKGFLELGESCYSLYNYLTQSLEGVGIRRQFSGESFREGVFQVPHLKHRFNNALEAEIVPGICLQKYFPEPELGGLFDDSLLICVHPKLKKHHIDSLVEVLSHD